MTAAAPLVEIYVNGVIEAPSERRALKAVADRLAHLNQPAVILANLHLGGRQIDTVVATAGAVDVLEVKASALPVRGDLNGPWSRRTASGDWEPYGNAYEQALAAKHAVRDAMSARQPPGAFYPDGYVVFASGIPQGSALTAGNFKVRVGDLDAYLAGCRTANASPWTLDDWRAFAADLSLTRLSLSDALAPPAAQAARQALADYRSAVAAEFGRLAAGWFPEAPDLAETVLRAALSGAGVYLHGPSGCGKSLMSAWLAAALSAAGHPTFVFAAKDVMGSWADSLRREVGLLTSLDPQVLLRAARQADQPIVLIVDGINEFGDGAARALRGLRALARRFGTHLVITGQASVLEGFAGLSSVSIAPPSPELKRRIAEAAGGPLGAVALEALKAVRTGFEARIVGQIGGDLRAGATRLALFDQYVRTRLGPEARGGALGLRRLASLLNAGVAFSLSETDFDEVMRAECVGFAACDAMFAGGLLVRRAGRVSFTHEMLLNACAAFDLARRAAEDPATFGLRLSTPLIEGLAQDIVAAIDNPVVAYPLLDNTTNVDVLAAAARGELGPVAAAATSRLLGDTLEACRAEIAGFQLEFVTDGDRTRAQVAPATVRPWTPEEFARLNALAMIPGPPLDLAAFLSLCAEMDARLLEERRRLAEPARAAKVGLSSEAFSLAYYGFGPRLGFTEIFRANQLPRDSLPTADMVALDVATLTSGQLHFYIEHRRTLPGPDADEAFAQDLIYILRNRFTREPYHVRLVALNAVGFARNASEATVAELIAALDALDVSGNWALSTSTIEALKILGGLEDGDEEVRAGIRDEVARAANEDDALTDLNLALSVCTRMFDHPYDGIYYEAIQELDEPALQRLYRRALRSAKIQFSMSLSWLAGKVADFADLADAPLMRDLAGLPQEENSFPQEEWAAFVQAIRFLGRHGAALPQEATDRPKDACLNDVRVLLYAAESGRPEDLSAASEAWRRLHVLAPQLVVGCLSEVQTALNEAHWYDQDRDYRRIDLVAAYPVEVLTLARRFIDAGQEAQYFHHVPRRESGPALAHSAVARFGDRSDLARLRSVSRGHPFARHAVAALKTLDAVPV
jgi:hypothetical protein